MIRQQVRAFWASIRIGWAIESNWTRVPLYLLYAAVRPLALCVLLYFVYKVVDPHPGGDPYFMGIYLGNAFFTVFITLTGGLSWAIITDREHYQIVRYVYITPAPFMMTVLGRAVTFLGIALSNVLLILLIGRFALGLPLGTANVDWILLVPVQMLGLAAAAGLGLFFAGLLLVTARHSMLLAEGIGGVFLLLCGVLYPTTKLPLWLQPVAWLNPLTLWIEASRRAFGVVSFDARLAVLPNWLLLILLTILTGVFAWLGVRAFLGFEHLAKRHGKIDQTTNY